MANQSDAKLIPADTGLHIHSKRSRLDPWSWHRWGT